jgi:hypothetical protein
MQQKIRVFLFCWELTLLYFALVFGELKTPKREEIDSFLLLLLMTSSNKNQWKKFRFRSTVSHPWILFPVALQPNFSLGRLHETFRFISVTTSRTVGGTSWTGDRFVARPLLTAPGDYDGEVGAMNGLWQGKPKYSEKTCPDATLSTINPTCQTRARTRACMVGSQRLTASAMARTIYAIGIVKINSWIMAYVVCTILFTYLCSLPCNLFSAQKVGLIRTFYFEEKARFFSFS